MTLTSVEKFRQPTDFLTSEITASIQIDLKVNWSKVTINFKSVRAQFILEHTYLSELLFCDKHRFKQLNMALMIGNGQKETGYIDNLLIYTLWYELSNVFVALSDFGKKEFTKNLLI